MTVDVILNSFFAVKLGIKPIFFNSIHNSDVENGSNTDFLKILPKILIIFLRSVGCQSYSISTSCYLIYFASRRK